MEFNQVERITILTGAGISAESGLATFRDAGGLWENYRIEDVCTPEAFERDPELVQGFYNMRRKQLKETKPNGAHYALAKLEERWPGSLFLVTQNVDDLHERAGSQFVWHMHGELNKARCTHTGNVFDWLDDITYDSTSPEGLVGTLRPHIVWFGEMPLYMDMIETQLRSCDLFIAVGTSGNVYPAAGFVSTAKHFRAKTLEINLEESTTSPYFDEHIHSNAGEALPKLVDRLLEA